MSTSKPFKFSKFWSTVMAAALVGAGLLGVSSNAQADGSVKFPAFMKKMATLTDAQAPAAFASLKAVCKDLKVASDECTTVTSGDAWKTAAEAKAKCATCHDGDSKNANKKALQADDDIKKLDIAAF